MRERRYIIVSEEGKPMTWHPRSQQLCYNQMIGYSRFKVQHYSKRVAEQLIKDTIANRKKWNITVNGSYHLMQIEV